MLAPAVDLKRCQLLIGAALVGLQWCAATAASPAVWPGLGLTFAKAAYADPTQSQNQDRIMPHVWLTRGNMSGLYNAFVDPSYDQVTKLAPTDTEWATILNNDGKSTAAANWANLTFAPWAAAYGGHVGTSIVGLDAVVHLISDDVYLDLKVTRWDGGEMGGAFTYERAAAPAADGDYNHDGFVNAADYTMWRDNLGQTVPLGTAADGNLNGTIDVGDYTLWKSQYCSATPGAGSGASAAVPEPSTISLTLPGLFSIVGLGMMGRGGR